MRKCKCLTKCWWHIDSYGNIQFLEKKGPLLTPLLKTGLRLYDRTQPLSQYKPGKWSLCRESGITRLLTRSSSRVVLKQCLVSISFKCVTRCASVIVDWVNVWIQPSGACVRFLRHWFGSVNPQDCDQTVKWWLELTQNIVSASPDPISTTPSH